MNKNKTLKPPGAGLPKIEAVIMKHAVFPLVIRKISREEAIQQLLETGEQCLDITKNIPLDQATQPTLIPRLTGLEDSSRNWSVIMTIQHLLITGLAMENIAIALANQKKPKGMVRIEDVKPIPGQSPDNILKDYQNFLSAYKNNVGALENLKDNNHTHAHPWFGELTAHDWLALNAAHHDLHMRQIKMILKKIIK